MNQVRQLLLAGGIAGVTILGAILWAGHVINQEAADAIAGSLKSLPHCQVALVLGCSPTAGAGRANPFFANRMQAAAAAYHAQRVDYLLVSGDHHAPDYDEPTAMQNALIHLGVPAGCIILDHAGFSTLDSISRAKAVFGLSRFCIVTQKEHALRAVFIARRQQLDVVAYPAPDVGMIAGLRTRLRESLARVRALLDVTILRRQPQFLGPRIHIGAPPDRAREPTAVRSAMRGD